MEGPSLVIATEELTRFVGRPLAKIKTTLELPTATMRSQRLTEVSSWGKHLLLHFGQTTLRVHFLMFGSYRVNDPRANRIPKLELRFGKDILYFYSCAIRELVAGELSEYNYSIDLMSTEWNARAAVIRVQKSPSRMVCDALLDQTIFAGLGNIMKNEILFRQRLHPEQKISGLSSQQIKTLVKDSQIYSHLFYEWKKQNVLKRNWQVFRKKVCPLCRGKVTKRATGIGKRISHYCSRCQPKSGKSPSVASQDR